MYNSQGKGEGWRKSAVTVMTVYWYRDRRSCSAECIMTGKGRRMEEEEGSAVSDDCVLVQRQALRWCRVYNSQGKGEGWRKRRGVLSV